MNGLDPTYVRWELDFPLDALDNPDPRSGEPCDGGICQTFAWRGYEPYCGWCHAPLREAEAE